MKVFYKEENWASKVNFVDENNVLVGFDNHDDCCAQGGWFIADTKEAWLHKDFKEEAMEFPGFVFDAAYFKELDVPKEEYEGGAVQFRLVKDGEQKFLTLYNFHNGYYSRGFEMSHGKEALRNGLV